MSDALVESLLLIGSVCGAIWLALAFWTVTVGVRHGGSQLRWLLYGLLLGPIGVWLAYWMVRPCPRCGATVLRDVHHCAACDTDIPRLQPHENPEDYLKTYRKNW